MAMETLFDFGIERLVKIAHLSSEEKSILVSLLFRGCDARSGEFDRKFFSFRHGDSSL